MKRMEEQMLHSEKLTALGRLSAGIAHEIGNPLTAVFSFLQILNERLKDEFNKESLGTIIFHMKRIAETVRQLSSLSKVPPPELKKVKISSVLRQCVELVKYDNRSANIRIEEALEDIPEFVTDENKLSQVFINLLLNAVDAMPGGGTLTINCRALTGRVLIDVQDTGGGIAWQNLSHIFDPFFTTKEKGTGLGLSVSYSIIKGLGGEIKVESSPGKGSRFTVELPVRREADAGKNSAG
jgi:signal transduction histidine kinase